MPLRTPATPRPLALHLHAACLAAGLVPPAAAQCLQRIELDPWTCDASADSAFDFGKSVAAEGDVLVVGAPGTASIDKGEALVLRRSPATGEFDPVVSLHPPLYCTGQYEDEFGEAVAIEDGRIFVGAPYDGFEIAYGTGEGAVYVYEPVGDSWVPAHKLVSQHRVYTYDLGRRVAADGDVLVARSRWAVHVFVRDAATDSWQETQVLWDDYVVARSFDVAVSNDTIFLGAREDDFVGTDSGSVRVWERIPGEDRWEETARFAAAETDDDDGFGFAVAADGDRLLVGAPFALGDRGRCYVFERNPATGSWDPAGRLDSRYAYYRGELGISVDLEGDSAVVGSYWYSSSTASRGAAFSFVRDPHTGEWVESVPVLLPAPYRPSRFARSVAAGDGFVAGGSVGSASRPGEVLVYDLRVEGNDCDGNGIADACDLLQGHATDGNANGVPDVCESLGRTFCGPPALNDFGNRARLAALGSTSVADDDLTLYVGGLNYRQQTGYLLCSPVRTTPFVPLNGAGPMCLANPGIGRFDTYAYERPAQFALSLEIDLASVPQPIGSTAVLPGDTWYFQFWYRDHTFVHEMNLSDGLAITFE